MESEEDEADKGHLAWQIWLRGIDKAVRSKLAGGTDDELCQLWLEAIDAFMELYYPEDTGWKQFSPNEKYEKVNNAMINYKGFIDAVNSSIDEMKLGLINSKQAEDENAKNIITKAFSRAAKREVKSGIDLEPGRELMSSEMIVELGITKKDLTMSLLFDPQVKAVDCTDGEFIVTTIFGEIKFRLVFGDEANGVGRA